MLLKMIQPSWTVANGSTDRGTRQISRLSQEVDETFSIDV
jgi:hypothetical protein